VGNFTCITSIPRTQGPPRDKAGILGERKREALKKKQGEREKSLGIVRWMSWISLGRKQINRHRGFGGGAIKDSRKEKLHTGGNIQPASGDFEKGLPSSNARRVNFFQWLAGLVHEMHREATKKLGNGEGEH